MGQFLSEVKETLPAMLKVAKEPEETTTDTEAKKGREGDTKRFDYYAMPAEISGRWRGSIRES